MEETDVVIAGGGIAGLTLASELSKNFKVVVLEEDRIDEVPKEWTTERQIIRKAGLEDFVTTEFSKTFLQAFNGEKMFFKDEAVSLDAEGLLKYFKDLTLCEGGKIRENTKFEGVRERTKDKIILKSSDRSYKAKLLVDCTGIDSGLAEEHGVYSKKFYYPVYGGVYDFKLSEDEINLYKAIEKVFPVPFSEWFPTEDDETVVYTFKFLEMYKDPEELEEIHERQLEEMSPGPERKDMERLKEVEGVIPIGIREKSSADQIFFFGDSALLGAPLVGSGFTRVIQKYESIADHLSECLEKDELGEKDLEMPLSEKEHFNRDLQSIVSAVFANSRPSEIEELLNFFGELDNEILADFLFMRLGEDEIVRILEKIVDVIGVEKLAEILPRREYILIGKETADMIKQMTLDEMKKLY